MSYPKFLPLREIGSSGWLDRNLSQNSGAGLTGHPSVHGYPFGQHFGQPKRWMAQVRTPFSFEPASTKSKSRATFFILT